MDLTNKKIGYNFKDKDLFILALTHKSASRRNNERLEFLGDSIINFYIAKELISLFPNLNEGKLTQIRASLVSRNFLNNMAKELKISKQLVLGKGETTENNSIYGIDINGNDLWASNGQPIVLAAGRQEDPIIVSDDNAVK